MIQIILFFIGSLIGSFLNVVIDRLPRGEGILMGRSHCDFCGHTLAWYDLVPFFSFILLHGKCRYCKKFIGWKYPIIEFTTGLSFAFMSFFIPVNQFIFFILSLFILSLLIIIFFTDLFSGIIPDSVIAVLGVASIARIIFFHQNILSTVIGSLVTGLFFFLLYIGTKKRGIGFGDVKYAFIMGLLLGFPQVILGLYIAFLTGASIAFILIIGKRKTLKSAVPFGPFLVLGTLCMLFTGKYLWSIFLHLLNL